MQSGSCAPDAIAAKGSRLGHFTGGHNVSVYRLEVWRLMIDMDVGLLPAVSLAWRSLA